MPELPIVQGYKLGAVKGLSLQKMFATIMTLTPPGELYVRLYGGTFIL